MGGMNQVQGGSKWCNLSFIMTSNEVFLKNDKICGVPTALAVNKILLKKVVEKGHVVPNDKGQITCECCGLPGGLLLQCAGNLGTRKRPCTIFQHPLCAELSDREQYIQHTKTDDIIHFKCAKCSFGEDALCIICKRGSRQNEMLECEACDKGIHMDCCIPKLEAVPEGEFKCHICVPPPPMCIEAPMTEYSDEQVVNVDGESAPAEEADADKPIEGKDGEEQKEDAAVEGLEVKENDEAVAAEEAKHEDPTEDTPNETEDIVNDANETEQAEASIEVTEPQVAEINGDEIGEPDKVEGDTEIQSSDVAASTD